MQAKLALRAKENIALDTLLTLKSENVELPLETIFENTITSSSAQSERERLARNAQLKMNWENRCQKQLEIGVMCGDKPWLKADQKTVSKLYLSLGNEGRRVICSRNLHLRMDILTTVELWKIIEDTIIRPRKITFDRYALVTPPSNQKVNPLNTSLANGRSCLKFAILEIMRILKILLEIFSMPICRTLKIK